MVLKLKLLFKMLIHFLSYDQKPEKSKFLKFTVFKFVLHSFIQLQILT